MEEQRTLVPETAKQDREIPARWAWVEPEVWTDKMLATLERGVKGGKWFSLIDKVWSIPNLESAWKKVAANRGSAGIDNVSIKNYRRHAKERLNRTSEMLKEGTYRPAGVKRVLIDKPGSPEKRPLGIPTVTDRVVQTALRNVIEPIFEVDFCNTSYGFRPGRSCKDALRRVDRLLKQGYRYVVDADIKGYFDSIPQDKLMQLVEKKIADGRILALLNMYLSQQVIDTAASWTPETGTPQGAVISPLLANIYLDPLDWMMYNKGYEMTRYADDFVVQCKTEAEAQMALEMIRAWTEEAGLTLHPTKTKIVNADEDIFVFLGYKFKQGMKFPSDKSIKKLRDNIRKHTRRNNAHSLQTIIDRIRPIQRGWFEYFKHAHRNSFPEQDAWIRRRLRSILKKHEKRKGIATTCKDNLRYPNAIFDSRGFFSLVSAHRELCQSLK
ncbi:MAG: group II intron reverse transcriptase/maturase [Candidatus Cloacimonadaceae bacterium]|nr:group II intron reverse transcriptase/maturase [Candidatus Cloacimonadaceae bacterium]